MFQKKLEKSLEQLLSQINFSYQPMPGQSSALGQELNLVKEEKHFFQRVQKNIYLLRGRTVRYIQSVVSKKPENMISDKQAHLYLLIGKKISELLDKEKSTLLQQTIMTLYIQLNELKQCSKSCDLTKITRDLLSLIITQAQPLLREYFVYQEYQIRIQKQIRSKQSTSCSLKTLPILYSEESKGQLSETLDEQLMEEIERDISQAPLSLLFDKEMMNEEKKMRESLQICRICFQQIKMMDMKRHVNNCAKKNNLKLQLELKNHDIKNLEESLKQKYQESCEESIHEQIDEDFRMICKLVLNSGKNGERRINDRRCSMVGVKSEKKICERIEEYIEDYLIQFGENYLLQELLTNYRERDLLEKKLSNMELNSLFSIHSFESEQKKEESQKPVRRSTKKNRTFFEYETTPTSDHLKSSFFAQKHNSVEAENFEWDKDIESKSSKSSVDIGDEKQDRQQQENYGTLIRKIKTKRSLSKKQEKQWDSEMQWDVSAVKHYSSLHNISIHRDDEGDNNVKSNISLKDFDILQFLGQGAFGKVYMARRKETRDIYAIKLIKLPENYSQKDLLAIKNQHQIFKKIAGDHLVKAPFAFSENSCHIFVLQFLPGGDLRRLLTDEIYFQEDKAAFYLAEIILAIEHLHKYQIIHRDLKPENLVIDRKGHLKLTDFGLSEFQVSKKLNQSRTQEAHAAEEARINKSRKRRRAAVCGVHRSTMNLIGTPDYIAPEIINQTSFSNYTIDWWSLGVMAYELIIGTRPFCADTIDEVIDNITNFNIEWPEVGYQEGMITPQAKDFISKLLNKDFTQRLGASGADELKKHPFMAGVDWQNVKSSVPLFVPRKMTRLSDIISMQEDKGLRSEIEAFIGDVNVKKVKKFQLQSFIRFDLLKSQTIENIEKKQEQTNKKLKRLRTLKDISNQLKIQDVE